MNLVSIRIITANLDRMVKFYEQVAEMSIIRYTPDFAELKTATTTLALGSTQTLLAFGGAEIASPAKNSSVIIEFRVGDVDSDYARLTEYLMDSIVQVPTLMPWGNKSFLFRDPDGNLVNLFTPITAAAIAKFDGEK